MGLRAISYELNCPKEEAVELILNNKSILHGRWGFRFLLLVCVSFHG